MLLEKQKLLIHAPSLAIGAIIASIVITGVIFGFNNTANELEILPTPTIGPTEPKEITIFVRDNKNENDKQDLNKIEIMLDKIEQETDDIENQRKKTITIRIQDSEATCRLETEMFLNRLKKKLKSFKMLRKQTENR